jgi:hypothetical protein
MVGDPPESTPPPPPDSSASQPAGKTSAGERRTTMAGNESAGKEFRRGLVSVVTGTRPGLERFLLASVPALTLGAVGAALFGRIAGLSIALVTLAVVMVLSRNVGGPE